MTPPDEVRRALKADLVEHDGAWLEVQCSGCRTTTLHPAKLLIRRIGPHHRLIDIIPRLSCKACRAKPEAIYLNETPYRLPCKGPPPGWSVQLFPFPVDAADCAAPIRADTAVP